jgi:hypothetical protein
MDGLTLPGMIRSRAAPPENDLVEASRRSTKQAQVVGDQVKRCTRVAPETSTNEAMLGAICTNDSARRSRSRRVRPDGATPLI